MLLFHGTTAPALDAILEQGLRPPQPDATGHDWMWDLSGRSQGSVVFLSSAPVAGKGGDPVAFAMGWPVKRYHGRQAGYIVVVDLPDEALDLVHAVVPNVELNAFISVSRTRAWLRDTIRIEAFQDTGDDARPLARWTLSHWCLQYWLARYCVDHEIALNASTLHAHFPAQISAIDPALPADLTPLQWQTFLDDYFRVVTFAFADLRSPAERERRRRAVLRKHNITLPEHIEEDDHCRECRLCIGGLAGFIHRVDGLERYQPFHGFLRTIPMKSGYHHLPPALRLTLYTIFAFRNDGAMGRMLSLESRLRAVRAHTQPFAADQVETFFRSYEASGGSQRTAPWTWEQWYTAFPIEQCDVPHTWHPAYCQRFDAIDLKRPDRQVVASSIPACYILGAIKVSDGTRLVPHLRPSRRKGETLAAKLWVRAHSLRADYAGKPIVLD